jgi:hypothetical protein
MLELKASPIKMIFTCPDCKCKFGKANEVFFYGMHIFADCDCECCENKYYHTLNSEPNAIALSQKTFKSRFDKKGKGTALALVNAIKKKSFIERPVSKKTFKESKEIILFNCLDFRYWQVFFKIIKVEKYILKFPQKSVVIIIPASFQRLIPEGISEVWQVESKLRDFKKRISSVDDFIKEELKSYDSVLLGEVSGQYDSGLIKFGEVIKKFIRK